MGIAEGEQVALLMPRVILGAFLLICSVGKPIDPGRAITIYRDFYGPPTSSGVAVAIGVGETALSALIPIHCVLWIVRKAQPADNPIP